MISQHFWPHLFGEDVRLHPSMEQRLKDFGHAYSVVKNPRLLDWKKQVRAIARHDSLCSVEDGVSVSHAVSGDSAAAFRSSRSPMRDKTSRIVFKRPDLLQIASLNIEY